MATKTGKTSPPGDLQDEIKRWRSEIRTDAYMISIGELLNIYRDGEMDLHPEFQRFFRWSPQQKSNFIESILLGIPVPSIFVSQKTDSKWEVVDGLQRLSTVFEFAGVLKDRYGRPVPPLTLVATKYLPSLVGKVWEEKSDPDSPNSIGADARIDIKRTKLQLSIILKESAQFGKFELFQRLNTGGSQATDQEVRSCILVATNEDFYKWIEDLASFEPFREAVGLSDRLEEEQYHIDLVLRFLSFRKADDSDLTNMGNIGDFLERKMLVFAGDKAFPYDSEAKAFRDTFQLLHGQLGPGCVRKLDTETDNFRGGFSISTFEGMVLGCGHHIAKIRTKDALWLRKRLAKLWTNDEFITWTGTGRSADSRILRTIPIGRKIFKP